VTPRRRLAEQDNPTGSPSTDEPVFLAVGKLTRPHGVRGEMIMEILTDFPERLKPGVRLYVGPERLPVTLRSRRPHARGALVAFEGFNNREQSGELRNHFVLVRADDRPPLPAGEYYHHQLIGLRVVDQDGREIGKMEDILQTGANDVYLVRQPDGEELLIPAIDSVILAIELDRVEIRVELPPGLLPEEGEAPAQG
jgi:16S rRNA processing protein RimM